MTHRTQPTPHQTLRDDVADVLAEADGWRWAPGFKRDSPTYLGYQERADAVLAVIPASDRPHVIREAIERVEDPEERAKSPIGSGLGWESAREVLRRMLHQAVGEQIVRPKTPTVDPAERRARYTEPLFAIMRQNGWDGERTEQGDREMDLVIDAILTVADAEQSDLRRERDLAIAHDRQPYPTAWAYEQACAALRRKTEAIERVLEWAAGLDDVARQVAGTDATHPVAAHIRHLLDTQQDGAQGPFRAGSSWTIETHRRGSWQRWMPDRDKPDEARQEYLRVITGSGSRWAFRLVRADTKYTVEAEHNPGGEPVVDVRPTDTARSDQDPAQDLASADNPTHLRWGLNDVLHGDDGTTTVLLSGPDLEAYWLELDPERAAALRQDLAGPDGPSETADKAAILRREAHRINAMPEAQAQTLQKGVTWTTSELHRVAAQSEQPTEPPVHVGGGANAETCPACKASPNPPPYPWVCPGPATEDTEEDDRV